MCSYVGKSRIENAKMPAGKCWLANAGRDSKVRKLEVGNMYTELKSG